MKREIKCPECKEWTLWQGHIDDRCLYCGAFLQPKEFVDEVERKAHRQHRGGFFFKPEKPARIHEQYNKGSFRYALFSVFYYIQVGFFAFISLLLSLIALLAG
ncbi:MAG: hypothetical protein INR69_00980 [Mucilaginibacter polytrichastri]|nr:hypothetical protein [Mucilaginibacter polytrichastri]